MKYNGTRAETKFLLSAKRTSPFKSATDSVQSITGSRGVRISGSNAGYTKFRGSVKDTDHPLHSPVSLHFPFRASPCAITFQLDTTANSAGSGTHTHGNLIGHCVRHRTPFLSQRLQDTYFVHFTAVI